jgi:hypothetical protein
LAQWEQFGKGRKKKKKEEERKNERKGLTLTGLLMEGTWPEDPKFENEVQTTGCNSTESEWERTSLKRQECLACYSMIFGARLSAIWCAVASRKRRR